MGRWSLTPPTEEELGISRTECYSYGFLWGGLLAISEIERYVLYVCLVASSSSSSSSSLGGCDAFLSTYALWTLRGSILAFANEITSGWLTDFLSSRRHRQLIRQLLLFMLVATILMIYLIIATPLEARTSGLSSMVVAEVLLHLNHFAMIQVMSSLWKLFKARIDSTKEHQTLKCQTPSHNSDQENMAAGIVGVVGDVVSEVISGISLTVTVFWIAPMGFITSVKFLCSVQIILLFVVMLFSHSRLLWQLDGVVPAEFQSPQIRSQDPDTFPHHEEEVVQEQPQTPSEEAATKGPLVKEKKIHNRTLLQFLKHTLSKRVDYIWSSSPVLHSFCHSHILILLYGALADPLTLMVTEEAESYTATTTAITTAQVIPHLANWPKCESVLIDLLAQGAILDLVFFVGTILYSGTLLRCPPGVYYGKVLPWLSVLAGCCLFSIPISMRFSLRQLRMFLLASCQVIIYFFNSFDYYVLTTSTRSKYYGVVMSFYALIQHGLNFLTVTLMSIKVQVPALLAWCGVLLLASAWHGWHFRKVFSATNWADDPSSSSEDLDK